MLFIFLWKFTKKAFFISRGCIKLLRPLATIQSVILFPLVLVLLLLPYVFARGEAIEEARHSQANQSLADYHQSFQP